MCIHTCVFIDVASLGRNTPKDEHHLSWVTGDFNFSYVCCFGFSSSLRDKIILVIREKKIKILKINPFQH